MSSDDDYRQCDVCGRKDYSDKLPVSAICDMTQPDGKRCSGLLQKKSNGSAVNHSDRVQRIADRRALAREDIDSLIECLAPREERTHGDVPEGMHPINLSVSTTLAAQWVKSLRLARKLI